MSTTLDRRVAAQQALADRQRLLSLGYTPLPSRGKLCIVRGWPELTPDEAMLQTWSRNLDLCSSGIRLEGRQVAIDLDSTNAGVVDEALDALFKWWPELNDAPERIGRAPKVLYLARLPDDEQPLTHMTTKHWQAPGGDLEHVEVFGGGRKRFIGWCGPHTLDDQVGPDGWIVHRTYDDKGSLVPAGDLPVITTGILRTWLAEVDAIFERHGYTEKRREAGATAPFVRDLTEDMTFECDDGSIRVGLEAMTDYASDRDARCSLSFVEPDTHNTTRCRVSLSSEGELRIFDFGDWVTHAPVGGAVVPLPIDLMSLGGALAALNAAAPAPVMAPAMTFAERVYLEQGGDPAQWDEFEVEQSRERFEEAMTDLFTGMVYDVTEEACRRIHDSPEVGLAVGRRMTSYAGQCLTVVGERGGKKKVNPLTAWVASPDRINVAGVRFMPGREVIDEEDGKRWLNLWREPELEPELVDPEAAVIWLKFLEHLIPDYRERDWFERFVANKMVNPRFRGAGVLMVAASTQGAGRSTLMSVLHEVFGKFATYVSAAQLFDSSQRNGWMEKALWAFGNEIGFSTRYNDKVQAYERLKDLVDPAQSKVRLDEKFMRPRDALIYTTFLLATNRPDALPISADDRRFMVITNGGAMPEGLRQELFGEWFNGSHPKPALVHTLRAYYRARGEALGGDTTDLTDAPKWAAGREELIDAGRTDVDEVFQYALGRIPEGRIAMPRADFEAHLLGELRVAGMEQKRGAIRHFVTGLQGAEAARWGWRSMGRIRLGSGSEDRARVVVRDISAEYFLTLSGEDRAKVLDNRPAGEVQPAS